MFQKFLYGKAVDISDNYQISQIEKLESLDPLRSNQGQKHCKFWSYLFQAKFTYRAIIWEGV